jgi:hypothetical protein
MNSVGGQRVWRKRSFRTPVLPPASIPPLHAQDATPPWLGWEGKGHNAMLPWISLILLVLFFLGCLVWLIHSAGLGASILLLVIGGLLIAVFSGRK